MKKDEASKLIEEKFRCTPVEQDQTLWIDGRTLKSELARLYVHFNAEGIVIGVNIIQDKENFMLMEGSSEGLEKCLQVFK